MKIGELSRRSGVSVRALRYYEEKDVLHPERTTSGYRVFTQDDVRTVAHIRTLLSAGLGLDLITEVLSCMSGQTLLLADCRSRLESERRRMTNTIDQLADARTMLDQLLAGATSDRRLDEPEVEG